MMHPAPADDNEVLVTETNDDTFLPVFARQRPFSLILLVTGVIGWVASGILVLERLASTRTPSMSPPVTSTPWSPAEK